MTMAKKTQRRTLEAAAAGACAGGPPAGAGLSRAWRKLADAGLFRLPHARARGGLGWSLLETSEVLETLGWAAGFTALPMAAGAQLWGVQAPLDRFGSSEQRRRFLSPLMAGRLVGALAATEEAAGSDLLALSCAAAPRGAGYALTGRKIFVSGAPEAGVFLVLARVEGRSGPLGLSAFLVPRARAGLSVRATPWAMGPWRAPTGTVELSGCRVSADERLGREGQGLAVFLHAMRRERLMILAPALGSMAAVLEESAAWARERSQSSRPVIRFQAVGHRLAEMRIRLQAARALLREACRGAADDEASSVVKAFVSEAWVANCLDAIAVRGARACQTGGLLQRELEAALAARIMSGTNDIQRNLIAARLASPAGSKEARE